MNLVFYAAFLLMGAEGGLLGTSIPYLTTYFHAPPEQAGLFITIGTIAGILSNLVVGRWLDHYPSRRVVWMTQVTLALSGVIMMAVTTWFGGLVAMFVFGLGFHGMLVAGNSIVTRINLPHPTAALNIMNMSFGIGAALGPQIVKQILLTQPIPVAFIAIGSAQLLLIPFTVRYSVPPAADHRTTKLPINVPLLTLILFGASLFTYTGAEVGFSSWISTQMIHVAGVAIADAGVYVSIFWVGITSGRLIASVITRRVSDEIMLIGASALVCISITLLLMFPQNPLIGALATFLFGLSCGPIFPTILAVVGRRYPDAIGSISGGLMAVGNLGVALIPWVQGQVSGGVSGGFSVTLVCDLILVGIVLLLARDGQRATASRPAA